MEHRVRLARMLDARRRAFLAVASGEYVLADPHRAVDLRKWQRDEWGE
jgi:hypothetical protein